MCRIVVPLFKPLAALVIVASTLLSSAQAQTCPFDDGNSSLAVEGVILTRYALGITGAPLVASTGINAVDAPTVEAAITCPSCGLNITGNPTMTVADATIISRKLAGFSGAQLTDGLALGSGTRNTPAAVQSFLLAGCGATGGTVTSVATGAGLTGGPVTSTGTISADTTYLQRRVSATCAVGSSIRAIAADGTVTCQTDATGGTGTVTSVFTGVGLSGGPITTAGTVNIDPTYRLPQACSNNQIARYNATGNVWECLTPAVVTSVATGPGLVGGPITATGAINLAATQLLPTSACATDQIIKWNGSAWVCASEGAASTAWSQGGNAFAAPGVIGTTDAQPLTVQSAGSAVNVLIPGGNGLRIVPGVGAQTNAPNVANGSAANFLSATRQGMTISGGGYEATNCWNVSSATATRNCRNSVSGDFATIGGGYGNQAGSVGTVSGGSENEAGSGAIGGGRRNRVSGFDGTVAGGYQNSASGLDSAISGGSDNAATGRGAAVPGGSLNEATGSYSTAMGRNAVARNWGQVAHAGNGFGAAPNYTPGTSQYSRMVLSLSSTTGSTGELLADGVATFPSAERRLRFFANQSAFIDATVFAKQTGASEAKAWTIKCIVMVDAAGAVTLSPSPCVPVVHQQTSALAWSLAVDTVTMAPDGVVRIRQTGVNGVPIRWVATVHLTELIE